MIKCLKLKIIKPIGMEWKMLGDILNKSQRETRNIMNKTIQLCWEWDNFKSNYKDKFDIYPKSEDVLPVKSLSGYLYNQLGKNPDNIQNTGNISQSLNLAELKWKNDKKEVWTGEKSIACYKQNNPIFLNKKNLKIYKEDNNYNFLISMLNNKFKKENNLESGQVMVAVDIGKVKYNKSTKTILNRCISGEYQLAGSNIKQDKKDKKWYINLSYNFEAVKVDIDDNKILGVDMGIKYPIYMAVGGEYQRGSIDGGEISKFRTTVEAKKRNILRQTKYCGEGRIGHGIKTRIKPVEKLSDRISNFRDTINHKYSKYVVDFAVKNGCGTIQMENLKGITDTKNRFLKHWTYFDLQSKIENKAAEKGIIVKKINPKYTSQRCNKCGSIDKNNRLTRDNFVCLTCGFKANADYNASLNIATPDIDVIIEQYIKDNKSIKLPEIDDILDFDN